MDLVQIILALTLVIGFYMAWNIGANDVANAMGTSVGSGSLTLKRAVILAAILEFSGAFFAGSSVTNTVRKGIVDPNLYADVPMLFVLGMLSALLAAAVWLQVASYFRLPVSTTHSIVGAIVGFSIVSMGFASVNWVKIAKIASSWVISPILGGIIAFLVFEAIKRKVLSVKNPILASRKMAPFFVFLVIFIVTLVMLFKGLKQLHLDFSLIESLFLATVFGAMSGVASYFIISKFLFVSSKKRKKMNTDERMLEVEKIFTVLQIISACFVAFAHGSNDVANAIGPIAAIIGVLETNSIQAQFGVPLWILGLGGGGTVIGLATWGWRVIETVGKNITELTPTRGFAAELGAATTIVLASKLGIPISTTHTLVGAVFGVGLARGISSLNVKVIYNIILSWFITIPAGAFLSILFYWMFKALLL